MSICIGLALSGLMIYEGLVIELNWSFILIVMISLVLNKINPKLTCLAYVMAIIYILDDLLIRIGLKTQYFKLSYVEMIYLVGILHVIEGILTFFLGGESSYPIMTYRGKSVAGGYQAYGKWIVPLLFFSIGGIYIPIIAGILYYNESFVLSPSEKAKKMGFLISAFGLIVIFICRLVMDGSIPLGVGILSMPLLHEVLFIIDTYIEKGDLKYPLPKEGIRVMEVLGENTLGINRGDIIKALNEKIVCNEEYYNVQMSKNDKMTIEVERVTGERVRLVCTAEELRAMKLIFLPPY